MKSRVNVCILTIFLFGASFLHAAQFGGWSVSQMLFDTVRSILPEGGTMLEFGSGWASGEFSKFYTVYSVEHSPEWVNKYDTNYIYAPIKKRWYDTDVLKRNLPAEYDLILVDGPPGSIGRWGFYEFLEFLNTDVPIVIDDVDRKAEHDLMIAVAEKLGRAYELYTDERKRFAVLLK